MRPDAVNLRILRAESRAWPTWDRVCVTLVHARTSLGDVARGCEQDPQNRTSSAGAALASVRTPG
jgi:hypothetical protein